SGEGEGAAEEAHVSSTLAAVSTEGEVADEVIFAEEAHDTYKDCKARLAKSRFFTETWLRIGEYHFDFDYSKMGLSNAISAYTKALEDKDSTFYDLALYKLAWSYWRHGNYTEAIKDFIEVVEYSDRKAEETGKSGSQLRPEAVQYIALSLWEPDWDGDGAPDPVSGLDRLMDAATIPQDRPWTSEVFNWLGDVYIDDNANLKAIKVFEEYLNRWPNASEAPEVVIKIAKAYQREKMEQQVIETRARLAQYGKDSDWWKANMDKPEIQQKALIAAEDALKQTALHHHEVAQNLKTVAKTKDDPAEANEIFTRAIEEYDLAATAYQKYLDNYPNTADSYEMHFFMAEAYFWSKQYEKSIPVYEEVRDSQMDNRYQKDAAFMVVKAVEQLRDDEVAKGMMTVREGPPEPVQGAGGALTVSAEVIPSSIKRLADAMDEYMKLFPSDKKNASAFTWNPAELYYNYGHWEEAGARFEKIYDKYCKTDNISAYSWQNMSAMASKLENFDESARLAKLQQEKQCGGTEDAITEEIGKTAEKVLISLQAKNAMAMFNKAKETGDKGLFEDSAVELEKAVDTTPDHEEADMMLWNAAIAYEECNKFQSALRVTQKIIDEYPKSDFMGDALFKLADNSFKAFEYNKALNNYKILADEPKFKDHPDRKGAVLNTALILENQQNYKEAAKYWKRYSEVTDKVEEAVDALWNAA
ncbi:MAG: tetratricopeptide repeat protein, partial [Actinobacteria bacterium]|nr:tetratricopeptide repeat protein [Actinomycetota bacterium]